MPVTLRTASTASRPGPAVTASLRVIHGLVEDAQLLIQDDPGAWASCADKLATALSLINVLLEDERRGW